MTISFPCSICAKSIGDNDDKCNSWIYIKCNNLNYIDYQYFNGDYDKDYSCNLVLKTPPNLNPLLNQFNNSSRTHYFKGPENVGKCKYYNLDELQTIKNPNKKSARIDTCSLSKNFKDLEYFLKATNIDFDIITISETRILKNINIAKNINVPNFSHKFTPTESITEGVLLYIAHNLAYQRRNNFNIYKKT